MKTEFSIPYAHCTKFTRGQLDRYPFSEYRMQQREAVIELVWSEACGNEWQVSVRGEVLSCEETIQQAIAAAAYKLMDDSRSRAANSCLVGK